MLNLNVCITGGSGFIGQNLTCELLAAGCRVVNFDLRAPAYRIEGDLTHICGDVRNKTHMQQVLQENDIQVLVHLAAISTVQLGAADTAVTHSVNVEGTRAVLQAAADYGKLHLLLYASTDKVYGKLLQDAYREDHPLQPTPSAYDQTKASADILVREYAREKGVPAVVLRFCNVYGPGDNSMTRIVPRSIRMLLDEHSPCILRKYEDAQGQLQEFYRDFIYIKDLCRAIIKIMEAREQLGSIGFAVHFGQAFNLGGEICLPMSRVLKTLQTACGIHTPVLTEVQYHIPEIEIQHMDCTKAKETFGFCPETSFEEGIFLTVKHWRACRLYEYRKI